MIQLQVGDVFNVRKEDVLARKAVRLDFAWGGEAGRQGAKSRVISKLRLSY